MFDTMTDPARSVIGGVDTHKDLHVVAAIDGLGRMLGHETFPADAAAIRPCCPGCDGGGAWRRSGWRVAGRGVPTWPDSLGCKGSSWSRSTVPTVRSKSDPVDEMAAPAVLAGGATAEPKAADGPVECIRVLRIAHRGARKAREQAGNQFHDLVDTAPEELRARMRNGSLKTRIVKASRFRPGQPTSPVAATTAALASVARRWLDLDREVQTIKAALDELVAATAPGLVARHGMGPDTVGTLLVAAGDNRSRLGSDGGFAALCGSSPVAASSGKRPRYRLNRGGDRDANSALWRIVIVRLKSDPRTQDYMRRRIAEGKSKREVIRCLKRYVARELYNNLPEELLRPAPHITTDQLQAA